MRSATRRFELLGEPALGALWPDASVGCTAYGLLAHPLPPAGQRGAVEGKLVLKNSVLHHDFLAFLSATSDR
jgi:hypothetical protein